MVNAFPAELALAATPQGRALFALKYSQKTILTKDYTAQRNDLGRGPIVMYIDVSGSMHGDLELWSKAIAIVIAEQALKDKRAVHINLFDTQIGESVVITPDAPNTKQLMEFVSGWSLGGGTSFNAVIGHAVETGPKIQNSDVLMLTDGHSEVSDAWIKRLNQFKQETGTQLSTLCLDTSIPSVCRRFSDEVYSVNTSNNAESIDTIQRCIL